jgi:replicative DNA helicase
VHATIFETMQHIYNKNQPVDYVTLTEKLERSEKLSDIGGVSYLTTLSNSVPSATNYKSYIATIKKHSILRQLIRTCEKIIEDAYSSDDNVATIQFAEKLIYDISKQGSDSSLEHVGPAIQRVMKKFEQIQRDPDSLKGLKTGIFGLDKVTNGLQKSDLIVLAARPGVGKTSFAMNIVNNVATNGGKVAFFALEMPAEQIMQRAICSTAFIDMAKPINGKMNTREWQKVTKASQKLTDTRLFIDDSSLNTPIEVLSKCRKLDSQEKLDLIVIDYLQLMTLKGKKESRQQEISDMSRLLKVASRELNIPIVVLSQLSRDTEKRKGDSRPVLSDLRGSGAIEQDADIVMFLHNPDNYTNNEEEKKGIVDLVIAKHRNGQLADIKLKFIKEHTTFVDAHSSGYSKSLEDTAPIQPESSEMQPVDPNEFDNDDIDDIL